MNHSQSISIFLCGDVMTGRGIDQILPHPGDPALVEAYVHDAREYVRLAERASGPIPRPVAPEYIWGDALEELERAETDLRIINLETSITTSDAAWPRKAVRYRMHPENIDCLTTARVDCCCLANNHVLDWGYGGLTETLRALDAVGIARAGAGESTDEAAAPVLLEVAGKGRVLVFSLGSPTSGIPAQWSAAGDRPGVYLVEDLSEAAVQRLAGQIPRYRASGEPGTVVVASIHWGGNWGYEIPAEQIRFAHQLVDAGVDLVHGHSSHHVKGIEVYRDRLIMYGCGDFLDDYEGIHGYEEFRHDLRLMYLAKLDAEEGRLLEARLVPLQVRRFRLQRADPTDERWLGDLLNRLSKPFGTQVNLHEDHSLRVRWERSTAGVGV